MFIKPAAIAACLMLMFASYTHAGQSGDYVGLSSGLLIIEKRSITDRENSTAEIYYDPGMSVSAFIGRQFDIGLRADGEMFYKNIQAKKIKYSGQSPEIDSRVQLTGAMANLYYNYCHQLKYYPFSPYFGLGAGLANVHMSKGADSRSTYWNDDNDTVFAYQGILGSSVPLYKDIHLDLSYRYMGTSDAKIDHVKTNFENHNILVGIVYFFK